MHAVARWWYLSEVHRVQYEAQFNYKRSFVLPPYLSIPPFISCPRHQSLLQFLSRSDFLNLLWGLLKILQTPPLCSFRLRSGCVCSWKFTFETCPSRPPRMHWTTFWSRTYRNFPSGPIVAKSNEGGSMHHWHSVGFMMANASSPIMGKSRSHLTNPTTSSTTSPVQLTETPPIRSRKDLEWIVHLPMLSISNF